MKQSIQKIIIVAAVLFALTSGANAAGICNKGGFNISADGGKCKWYSLRGKPIRAVSADDEYGNETYKISYGHFYKLAMFPQKIFTEKSGVRAALFHKDAGQKIDGVTIEPDTLHLLIANESGAPITYTNSEDAYFYARNPRYPILPMTAMIDESVTVKNGEQGLLRFAYTGHFITPNDKRAVIPYFSEPSAVRLVEDDCPSQYEINQTKTVCVSKAPKSVEKKEPEPGLISAIFGAVLHMKVIDLVF